MTEYRIRLLEAVGFVWDAQKGGNRSRAGRYKPMSEYMAGSETSSQAPSVATATNTTTGGGNLGPARASPPSGPSFGSSVPDSAQSLSSIQQDLQQQGPSHDGHYGMLARTLQAPSSVDLMGSTETRTPAVATLPSETPRSLLVPMAFHPALVQGTPTGSNVSAEAFLLRREAAMAALLTQSDPVSRNPASFRRDTDRSGITIPDTTVPTRTLDHAASSLSPPTTLGPVSMMSPEALAILAQQTVASSSGIYASNAALLGLDILRRRQQLLDAANTTAVGLAPGTVFTSPSAIWPTSISATAASTAVAAHMNQNRTGLFVPPHALTVDDQQLRFQFPSRIPPMHTAVQQQQQQQQRHQQPGLSVLSRTSVSETVAGGDRNTRSVIDGTHRGVADIIPLNQGQETATVARHVANGHESDTLAAERSVDRSGNNSLQGVSVPPTQQQEPRQLSQQLSSRAQQQPDPTIFEDADENG